MLLKKNKSSNEPVTEQFQNVSSNLTSIYLRQMKPFSSRDAEQILFWLSAF